MTGWECPTCHRCFSPATVMCLYCPAQPVTAAGAVKWSCQHGSRINGVCQYCGDVTAFVVTLPPGACQHAVIVNGACEACGLRPIGFLADYSPDRGDCGSIFRQ